MSLAIQANLIGLNTRAMGGIDFEKAYEVAKVPKKFFEVICCIAVGKQDIKFPENGLQLKVRKDLKEFVFKNNYK